MNRKIREYYNKIVPYWCPNCPNRYMREKSFHKHYLVCEDRRRLAIEEHNQRIAERIAPVNREQRRNMAKKAGAIKDWGDLNE